VEIEDDSYLWLNDSDLLVQRGNSIEHVGVSAIYKGPSRKFVYPDLMMKIRVSSNISVDYVHLAMNCKLARDYLRQRATGTSGSMPKINHSTLVSLPIPLPPFAEQRRIVARVNQLMALCDDLEAKLKDAQAASGKLLEATVKHLLTHSKTRGATA
jgi:type I restriction enzyme S subunit